MRIFGTNVDEAFGGADGNAGDRHAFDQDERIAFHDHPVGEGAAVAFVSVADDVFPVGFGVSDGLPLDAGREAGAAAPAQPRLRDLLDDSGRVGERFREPFVAVVRFVIFERTRIDDAATRKCQTRLPFHKGMIFRHADAQFVIAAARDHRIKHALDVAEFDRAVGDPAFAGDDFEHRLEPMHPARSVAHDLDLKSALGYARRERGRNLVGAAGDGRGISRNVNAKRGHRSASASSASSFFASRRATILPSIMAEGDTEHRPRQ